MYRVSNIGRALIGIVAFAILLSSLILLGTQLLERSKNGMLNGPPTSPEYTTVRQQNFGTWSYIATKSDIEPLHATINYTHETVDDIQAYANASRALLPEIVNARGQAEVAITFVHPVEVQWYRTWAIDNQLIVESSQLRVGAPGTSGAGTVSISGAGDNPLPDKELDNLAMGFFKSDIRGVFGAYGRVDASRISTLAAEPRVFLVDVTPAWVRLDLARNGVTEKLPEPAFVDLPYGWMERLGLENFSRLPVPTFPPPLPTYQPTMIPLDPGE